MLVTSICLGHPSAKHQVPRISGQLTHKLHFFTAHWWTHGMGGSVCTCKPWNLKSASFQPRQKQCKTNGKRKQNKRTHSGMDMFFHYIILQGFVMQHRLTGESPPPLAPQQLLPQVPPAAAVVGLDLSPLGPMKFPHDIPMTYIQGTAVL